MFRVLDLFCGAGGAAMGLHRAWPDADILGVDIVPQPRYPFRFVQSDAMGFPLKGYDFIWASPPCQAYLTMNNRYPKRRAEHPQLIDAVRARGVDVIENTAGAPLKNAILLHGGMFGLPVRRPRRFELSFPVLIPRQAYSRCSIGVYGDKPDARVLWTRRDGTKQRAAGSLAEAREAMGIDWMEWDELKEAIPPAYSEFIARQFRV